MSRSTELQKLIAENPEAPWSRHAAWLLERLGESWVLLVQLPVPPHEHDQGPCWACRRKEWLERMK